MKPNKQILRMQQLAGLITESEVKEKFDNDKMKEIKLKESIRAEVRNKNINEGREFLNENEEFSKAEVLKMKEDLNNFLNKYDYIMAPLDVSKVNNAVSALNKLALELEEK